MIVETRDSQKRPHHSDPIQHRTPSVTAQSLSMLQEEIERKDQEAKAIEANRMQVLEKLAASVPYAEACANAEAKLDHVTGR